MKEGVPHSRKYSRLCPFGEEPGRGHQPAARGRHLMVPVQPVCPHCGRPLHPRKLPDDLEQLSCALVLEEADFNDPNLAALLGELMGCAEEEAATLRGQTPLVVQRALSCAACMETAQRFGRGNSLSVYLDEDAVPGRLSRAQPICSCAPQSVPLRFPRPLSFWKTVGAILTALALWNLFLLILGFILASV